MFRRIGGDLSMLCDREIQVDSVTFEEREDLPASQEGVYISFRFAFDNDGAEEHGTLLIPLAESISLGGNLMMAGAAQIAELQERGEVEGPLREAILEVGAFVAGALQSAVEVLGMIRVRVEFEGCQGVQPNVPPMLKYEEGAPLIVGRAALRMGADAPVQMVLVLPVAAMRAGA
jgi:hypothetical protein